MSLDKLIKDGEIVPFKATKEEIKRALKIAERDLKIAEATFDKSLDWCFSICYNAYLQACRAYMFSLGYRSSSYQSHKTTVEFMEHTLDESYKDIINYFDRARRKRHRLVYNDINAVSITETKEMLHKVEVFLNIIKDMIKM
jgi:uncharacterized protein (UPF0332 family)